MGLTAVTVTTLRIDPTPACGRLLAQAMVEIEVAGCSILLQGVRVIARPDGSKAVEAPTYRGRDGRWLPAVVLPVEIAEAVSDMVFETLAAGT